MNSLNCSAFALYGYRYSDISGNYRAVEYATLVAVTMDSFNDWWATSDTGRTAYKIWSRFRLWFLVSTIQWPSWAVMYGHEQLEPLYLESRFTWTAFTSLQITGIELLQQVQESYRNFPISVDDKLYKSVIIYDFRIVSKS